MKGEQTVAEQVVRGLQEKTCFNGGEMTGLSHCM